MFISVCVNDEYIWIVFLGQAVVIVAMLVLTLLYRRFAVRKRVSELLGKTIREKKTNSLKGIEMVDDSHWTAEHE